MNDSERLDALGVGLNVGDIVACMDACGRYSHELHAYEVIGFTPKKVRLRRIAARTTKPYIDKYSGQTVERVAFGASCVRIDVKAYLGLAA